MPPEVVCLRERHEESSGGARRWWIWGRGLFQLDHCTTLWCHLSIFNVKERLGKCLTEATPRGLTLEDYTFSQGRSTCMAYGRPRCVSSNECHDGVLPNTCGILSAVLTSGSDTFGQRSTMAKCRFCGAETALFHADVPVCLECDADWERKQQQQDEPRTEPDSEQTTEES